MFVSGYIIHIRQLINLLPSWFWNGDSHQFPGCHYGWSLLLVERRTSFTMSQRSRASNPSIRNPASREIISDSVDLRETELCFLHIQQDAQDTSWGWFRVLKVCYQVPLSDKTPRVVLLQVVHSSTSSCPQIHWLVRSLPLSSRTAVTNSPLLRLYWADLQNELFGTRVLCLLSLHWSVWFLHPSSSMPLREFHRVILDFLGILIRSAGT